MVKNSNKKYIKKYLCIIIAHLRSNFAAEIKKEIYENNQNIRAC